MSSQTLSALTMVLGFALMGSVIAMPAADAEQRMMISGTLEIVEEDLHGSPSSSSLSRPSSAASAWRRTGAAGGCSRTSASG
jgi:hypothetical protein